MPKGGAALQAAEPKRKRHDLRRVFFFWQPEKDSNPHKQSQSLSCYPYTIRLFLAPVAGTNAIIANNLELSRGFFIFFVLVCDWLHSGLWGRQPSFHRLAPRAVPRLFFPLLHFPLYSTGLRFYNTIQAGPQRRNVRPPVDRRKKGGYGVTHHKAPAPAHKCGTTRRGEYRRIRRMPLRAGSGHAHSQQICGRPQNKGAVTGQRGQMAASLSSRIISGGN